MQAKQIEIALLNEFWFCAVPWHKCLCFCCSVVLCRSSCLSSFFHFCFRLGVLPCAALCCLVLCCLVWCVFFPGQNKNRNRNTFLYWRQSRPKNSRLRCSMTFCSVTQMFMFLLFCLLYFFSFLCSSSCAVVSSRSSAGKTSDSESWLGMHDYYYYSQCLLLLFFFVLFFFIAQWLFRFVPEP